MAQKLKHKTHNQIEREIQALKKIKPLIRQFSMFGDNHHAAIDAQINVLENNFSIDEVCDHYPCYPSDVEDIHGNGVPENVADNAKDAAEWITGESEIESIAKEWEELKIK